MSVSDSIPALDSLRLSKTPAFSSMDMLRVRWRPFGHLQSTIEVADDLDAGCNSATAPYKFTDGVTSSYHQISTSPATDPPVSSITVKITDLEDWPWRWAENHEDCGEGFDDGNQVWAAEDGDESVENNGEEDERSRKLMRCCNQNRPQAPPPLAVCSTAQEYVTVHDYITQVYPWVESLQTDIVAAMKENNGSSPSMLRYMTLLSLDTPHIRDDEHGRANHYWNAVAEHARLRRDGRMIGRVHTDEENTPLPGLRSQV